MPTQFHFGMLATIPGASINAIIPGVGASETITPTGSNQQTTVSAAAGQTICRVVSTGADVYVEFGSNPNATNDAGGRLLIPAGAIEYVSVSAGDKAAVVTA